MVDFDAAIIGAGVVGLAVAAKLARGGLSVVVLEEAAVPGAGNSSRNSEVIHAGLYYPTGSLKHRLCIRGRRALSAFLPQNHIPYRKCGKLIVATNEREMVNIEALFARGIENGVEGVTLVSSQTIHEMEPEVRSVGGIWSPETAIFDSHSYMLALIAQIEVYGGLISYRTPVLSASFEGAQYTIHVGGAESASFTASRLINSAGLYAPQLARNIEGFDPVLAPEQWLALGCYFGLSGRAPFTRLIYPAPVDGGLGVHSTLDLAGRVRFGPDVSWLPSGAEPTGVNYTVAPERADIFYTAIRRYWPSLPYGVLVPDYAGCRPKLSAPGQEAADFKIQTEEEHGLPGLINLFGIESPGLTSSLAISEDVATILL